MAKFFRRGISKVHFLPAVSDTSAPISPTRAEITAGEDLSPFLNEMNGFQLSNSPIPTPVLANRYTTQITGEDTTPDSSITFLDDDTATDVRAALEKDTAGFLVLMPYGDVPTKRCEVWPVTVTGANDQWSTGNDPARFVVGFAVTGVPEQNGVVPAAV